MICFSNLEIFEAPNNFISDLFELEMCSSLKRLNFKNNLIKEEENFSFLESLTELKWLNLLENPIRDNNRYPRLIEEFLPNLEYLDVQDIPFSDDGNLNLKLQTNESDQILNFNLNNFNQSVSTFSSSPSLLNKTIKNVSGENSVEFNNLSGSYFFRKEDRDDLLSKERDQINSNNTNYTYNNNQNYDRNNLKKLNTEREQDDERLISGTIQGIKRIINLNTGSNKNNIGSCGTNNEIHQNNSCNDHCHEINNKMKNHFSLKNQEKSESYRLSFRGNSQNNNPHNCTSKKSEKKTNNTIDNNFSHEANSNNTKNDNEENERDISTCNTNNSSLRLRPVIVKKEITKDVHIFNSSIDVDKIDSSNIFRLDRTKPLNPLKLSKIGKIKNKNEVAIVKDNYLLDKSHLLNKSDRESKFQTIEYNENI